MRVILSAERKDILFVKKSKLEKIRDQRVTTLTSYL